MTTPITITQGSKVLWLNTLHGKNSIEDGDVIGVWGEGDDKRYSLVWLEGYKSRNEDLRRDQIFAIIDRDGPEFKLWPFSGRGYLTDAGRAWLEANPQPESAKEEQPSLKQSMPPIPSYTVQTNADGTTTILLGNKVVASGPSAAEAFLGLATSSTKSA